MGFKQVTDGTWVAWYSKRHPITRLPVSRRRKNLKSKAEAARVEKELVIAIEKLLHEVEVPTWETLVAKYLEELNRSDMSKKTTHSYACMLKSATLSAWSGRSIDAISTQEIRDLINGLTDKTDHTKKYILKCVRGAFKFAVEAGFLDRNPVPEMKIKIKDKIRPYLTETQVRLLLDRARACQHPWMYHWTLALYTGMRNGELFALTWDRVDLENRTILVDSAWNQKDGFKDSTKSGQDRKIGIAPALVPILKELKLQTGETGFVLARLRGWQEGEQAAELRKFLMAIGLPLIRFHDLRATWATLLLAKGVEPVKVLTMGGWRSLKTMQIYLRKSGVDIQGATDCLNLHASAEKTGIVLDFQQA